MKIIILICQLLVSFGLLNVWLLRFRKPTPYRGASSISMPEEFATYGLPSWLCYFVGFVKISSAMALLIGLLYPALVIPTTGIITFLMIGAVVMHIKVGDPFQKCVPALSMLALCILVINGHWTNR